MEITKKLCENMGIDYVLLIICIKIGVISMIRVAICDDEPATASLTETLTLNYNKESLEVDIYSNSKRLLSSLNIEETYDFFILDIEIPGISGILLAEEIRKQNNSVPIIFLTSYKEYMEDVFRLQTFDYILKPITRERLYPVLDKVINFLALDTNKFTFSYKKATFTVPLKEILYFEKNRRQIFIHTLDATYETNMTTETLLNKLDNRFVQVHTSYIVNVNFITELNSKSLFVGKNGKENKEIPMSRKFKESARTQIFQKLGDTL
jgi:DNA-binding LytR/AlgR family response regulator